MKEYKNKNLIYHLYTLKIPRYGKYNFKIIVYFNSSIGLVKVKTKYFKTRYKALKYIERGEYS